MKKGKFSNVSISSAHAPCRVFCSRLSFILSQRNKTSYKGIIRHLLQMTSYTIKLPSNQTPHNIHSNRYRDSFFTSMQIWEVKNFKFLKFLNNKNLQIKIWERKFFKKLNVSLAFIFFNFFNHFLMPRLLIKLLILTLRSVTHCCYGTLCNLWIQHTELK